MLAAWGGVAVALAASPGWPGWRAHPTLGRRRGRTARGARRLAARDAHRAARPLGGGHERRRCSRWPTATQAEDVAPARRRRRGAARAAGPRASGSRARRVLSSVWLRSGRPVRSTGPAAALWHPRRAWEATIAPGANPRRSRGRRPRGFDRARARGVRAPHGDALAPLAGRGVAAVAACALDSAGHARVTTRRAPERPVRPAHERKPRDPTPS